MNEVIATTEEALIVNWPFDDTLYIVGTDRRDHVNLTSDEKKNELKVDLQLDQRGSDGGPDVGERIQQTFPAAEIKKIVAYLFDGNDHYNGGSEGGSDGGSDGGADKGAPP